MKKLTELIISMAVERDVSFILIMAVMVAHLATNPVVGGRPLKLAKITIPLQGDRLCSLSEGISFLFVLFIKFRANNTLSQ